MGWTVFEQTFIDARVFNPMAPSKRKLSQLVTVHTSKRSGGHTNGMSSTGHIFQLFSCLVVKERVPALRRHDSAKSQIT